MSVLVLAAILLLHGLLYRALCRLSAAPPGADGSLTPTAAQESSPRESGLPSAAETRARLRADASGRELERIKRLSAGRRDRKLAVSSSNLLFEAGFLSAEARQRFLRRFALAPAAAGTLFVLLRLTAGGAPASGASFGPTIYAFAAGYATAAAVCWAEIFYRRTVRRSAYSFYLRIFLCQCLAAIKAEGGAAAGLAQLLAVSDRLARIGGGAGGTAGGKPLPGAANPLLEILRLAGDPQSGDFPKRLAALGRLTGHVGLRHAFAQLSRIDQSAAGYSRVLIDQVKAAALENTGQKGRLLMPDFTLGQQLLLARLPLNERQWRGLQLLWLVAAAAIIGLGSAIAGDAATILVLAMLPGLTLSAVASVNAAAGRRELLQFLVMLRGLLNAGMEPLAAMLELSRTRAVSGSMAAELDAFAAALKAGGSIEAAMAAFCRTLPLAEVELLRVALVFAAARGGDLELILEQLAQVLQG